MDIDLIINTTVSKDISKFLFATQEVLSPSSDKAIENKAAPYLNIAETITDYYTDTHAMIRANPYKKESVDTINSIYMEHADNTKNSIANSAIGRRFFRDHITHDEFNILFVKGDKGVGKSIFINHFLANDFKLLEDAGVSAQ